MRAIRFFGWLVWLLLLGVVVTGCRTVQGAESNKVIPINLDELFPGNLQPLPNPRPPAGAQDKPERWIVFYRFDLTKGKEASEPISAVVYRPDQGNGPSPINPYALDLPGREYLCEHSCSARLEDVVGDKQKELLIEDKFQGQLVRVSIFTWPEDGGPYEPLGHFWGDGGVTVEKNKVTVLRLLHDRSQLAWRYLYYPWKYPQGHSYYRPDQSLVEPFEAEIVPAYGLPDKPWESRYPEKVIIGFYYQVLAGQEGKNRKNPVGDYMSAEVWESLGKCEKPQCGCPWPRSQIKRVLIKQIGLPGELNETFIPAGGGGEGSFRVQVPVQVVCESGKRRQWGAPMIWLLEKPKRYGFWKIIGAKPAS